MSSNPQEKATPRIAITVGELAGIGPEVAARTLRDPRLPRGFHFELLGLEKGKSLGPGKLNRTSARVALKSLEAAAAGCRDGTYAAMVTGPVQKETLAEISPGFVGQTEFLARACGLPDDAAVMILTDPKLTVALCTNHCSLINAVARLRPERIIQVVKITREFLRRRGVAKPRLAFAGINPHMGESNLFGNEDELLVRPAIRKLATEGIPVAHQAADTVFHHAVEKKAYDAVICAYHDQALIPFKLVAFQTGVNVTAGLPLIRTSPDHGTALEIAGRGKADHRSMLAAVRLACELVAGGKAMKRAVA